MISPTLTASCSFFQHHPLMSAAPWTGYSKLYFGDLTAFGKTPLTNAFARASSLKGIAAMTDNAYASFRLFPGRRLFLARSGQAALSAAAIALLTSNEVLAVEQKGKASGAGTADVGILNTALSAELEAIAAYQIGAESGLLQKPVLDLATQFQGHHKAHAVFSARR
jgi:hypothetical protein